MPLEQPLPLGVTAVMLAELDFDEQVAHCRRLGVTHYVFRPRYIAEQARGKPYRSHGNYKFDLTPERLVKEGEAFRRQLEDAGMVPFCTVPQDNADVDDDMFRLHLEGAAAAGATRIKVTPPNYPDGVFDYDAYLENAIERYRQLCDAAAPYGIKVVIEMHVGNAASAPGLARNILSAFSPEHLGVIVDLPNFAREGFVQPNLALSVLKPWVDHVHLGGLRRTAGEYDAYGFRQSGAQMCPLTESDLHIPSWIEHIAAANPAAPLIIEDYTQNLSGLLRLEAGAAAITRLQAMLVQEGRR